MLVPWGTTITALRCYGTQLAWRAYRVVKVLRQAQGIDAASRWRRRSCMTAAPT